MGPMGDRPRHHYRVRLATAFVAASLLAILTVARVDAEVLPALEVVISFRGACSVDGSIRIVNETTGAEVLSRRVSWSAEQDIEFRGFGGASDSTQVLRLTLFGAYGTTALFESTAFDYGGGSRFRATLACNATPYQLVMPDSAVRHTPRPSTAAGLLLLLLAVMLYRSRCRRWLATDS
jgi:hypothetical protein